MGVAGTILWLGKSMGLEVHEAGACEERAQALLTTDERAELCALHWRERMLERLGMSYTEPEA